MKAPDLEALDLDGLDDFDSDGFGTYHSDDTYLRGMWGGLEKVGANLEARALIAHQMVQSFVNAFARDGVYDVRFSERTVTAGTDMKARKVLITTGPLADQKLTAEEAGLILTGLAVHEISHPRYGRETSDAVRQSFGGSAMAHTVSNLLDDIRIEQRFIADYPGYAGVFDPTLDYIGSTELRRTGARPTSQDSALQRGIDATRYDSHVDWKPEHEADRDWWKAWSARWGAEDSPRRHCEGVREALIHIMEEQAKAAAKRQASSQQAAGTSSDQGNGASGDESAPSEDTSAAEADAAQKARDLADQLSDYGLGNAADANEAADPTMPDQTRGACSGKDAVDNANTTPGAGHATNANIGAAVQSAIDVAQDIQVADDGTQVDVARSINGLSARSATPVIGGAAAAIRNAIMRSRTGHEAVDAFQKRGRLDTRGLHRHAFGDPRLFERRTAPSPGRYLVWYMVDASSSMDGLPMQQAAETAFAFATAGSGIPSVRQAVYAWTMSLRRNYTPSAVRVWGTGEDPATIMRMVGLSKKSTPDAQITRWAGGAITKATIGAEQPVLVILSDGEGDHGAKAMDDAVAAARAKGVRVIGVSYGSAVTEDILLRRFGRGNYVTFRGSVAATAKPLADLIASVVSK